MEVTDSLLAMARTEELLDGTEARALVVEKLYRQLFDDPESFWEEFFAALNSFRDDPTRELAARLVRTGAVNGLTTIADLREILTEHYAAATPLQAMEQ
ncbi:MAG: hypothetical protein HIU91_10085 [Acidobacteria bacterium]|nr:hypothetical protein [Acidobacteriota bacterium]